MKPADVRMISKRDFMDKSPIGLVGQEKKQRQDKAVTPLWKKWG